MARLARRIASFPPGGAHLKRVLNSDPAGADAIADARSFRQLVASDTAGHPTAALFAQAGMQPLNSTSATASIKEPLL